MTSHDFWRTPIPSLASWQRKGPHWAEELEEALRYIWCLNTWRYEENWDGGRAAEAVGLSVAQLRDALPHIVSSYGEISIDSIISSGLERMRVEGSTAREVGFPCDNIDQYLRADLAPTRTKRRPA